MTRRRSLAVTLVASLTLLVTGSLAPAPAFSVAKKLTTSYTCTSDYGSGTSAVTVAVDLPRRSKVGRKLKARPIDLSMMVPEEMVAELRRYGVDAVSGSSSDAAYRIRKRTRPIRDLVLPRTAVPATGPMTLVGSGRAAAYRFKARGKHPVRVPLAFTAHATAHGVDYFGDVAVELSCTLNQGAAQRIAVIRVRA
jgi:hypothetical protein